MLLLAFVFTRVGIPMLEGTTHLVAIPLMLCWAIPLIRRSQTSQQRWGLILHTAVMELLFLTSVILHALSWRYNSEIWNILFRTDMTMICLAIGGMLIPTGIILLRKWSLFVSIVGIFVSIGIALSVLGIPTEISIMKTTELFGFMATIGTMCLLFALLKSNALSWKGCLVIVVIGLLYLIGSWINTQTWVTIPRVVDGNEYFHMLALFGEWVYIRFFKRYLLTP